MNRVFYTLLGDESAGEHQDNLLRIEGLVPWHEHLVVEAEGKNFNYPCETLAASDRRSLVAARI